MQQDGQHAGTVCKARTTIRIQPEEEYHDQSLGGTLRLLSEGVIPFLRGCRQRKNNKAGQEADRKAVSCPVLSAAGSICLLQGGNRGIPDLKMPASVV